jgi:hypothetical protein
MALIRLWRDARTGLSLGNACWVVGEVQTDTERDGTRIKMAVYVGLAEYSAGRQPIDEVEQIVTGSAYFQNFDTPNRSMAQGYVAGLPEFSGSTAV